LFDLYNKSITSVPQNTCGEFIEVK